MKGVCYSPIPWGRGTHPDRIGDWFTNTCSALWKDKDKDDPSPREDLKRMKEGGINHLRTYFWWEWWWPDHWFTKESPDDWVKRQGWEGKVKDGDLKDKDWPRFEHAHFLDQCLKNGIYVMIGLAVNSSAIYAPNGGYLPNGGYQKRLFVNTARQIGLRYGKHAAVMGLCVGNEQNQPGSARNENPLFWGDLGEMAQAFKQNAPEKITMVAFQNDPDFFNTKVGAKTVKQVFKEHFQIYGLNIYGDPTNSPQNFKTKVLEADGGKYACPLIVSEWGVGGGKNVENPNYQQWIKSGQAKKPDGSQPGPFEGPPFGMANARELTNIEFNQKVQDLLDYFGAIKKHLDFVVGSEYFSWSDEWWKNATDDSIISQIKNRNLILDSWGRYREPGTGHLKFSTYLEKQEASADPDWPEEYWGLFSIDPQGTPPGIKWNHNGWLYDYDYLKERPTWAALTKAYGSLV